MKLTKTLLASSILALSSAYISSSYAADPYSPSVAATYNKFISHSDFVSNYVNRFDVEVRNFSNEASRQGIEDAVSRILKRKATGETNFVAEQYFQALQQSFKDHIEAVTKIYKDGQSSNAPLSEIAGKLADQAKATAKKLEEATKKELPNIDPKTIPGLDGMFKHLAEESAALTATAVDMRTNAPSYVAAYDTYAGLLNTRPAFPFGGPSLDVNKVRDAIFLNGAEIHQLKIDVEKNRRDIAELRKQHRHSIAQVAAMASIDFGNVKARTVKVGAALGNYKNATAIAVGAAIAPNDRWLINAKASTTSGKNDFTFGIGATYEFSY